MENSRRCDTRQGITVEDRDNLDCMTQTTAIGNEYRPLWVALVPQAGPGTPGTPGTAVQLCWFGQWNMGNIPTSTTGIPAEQSSFAPFPLCFCVSTPPCTVHTVLVRNLPKGSFGSKNETFFEDCTKEDRHKTKPTIRALWAQTRFHLMEAFLISLFREERTKYHFELAESGGSTSKNFASSYQICITIKMT